MSLVSGSEGLLLFRLPISRHLHEVYQMDPNALTRLMVDNNIIMPINHSETLTKMWGDLHS